MTEPTHVDRLKPCELRITLASTEGHRFLCGASGLPLPKLAESVCGSCIIPDLLATDPWACLHLRPIRIDLNPGGPAYFACRWFYNLRPERQPTDLAWCHHCPYWFPRPPLSLIARYWQETDRIREAVRRALAASLSAGSPHGDQGGDGGTEN
jgi:hypothetical protein